MPGINIRRIALLGFLVVGHVTLLFARDADYGPSLAQRLAGDAADGRLDQFSLFEASLIAGGLESPSEVAAAVHQFEARYQLLVKKLGSQSTSNRVHALFDGLHQQFLHGDYRADYSELHRTLNDGHFNCVTATILFRYLCERSHIKSEVIASPNHVLCRVPDLANPLIETTCPECPTATGEPFGEQSNPLAESRSLRVITDVELVGKVFYNRGVAALDAKKYSQAAGLLVSANQFDRADAAARENLLATLNNWALAACDRGEYETASHLVNRGQSLDKNYPPLQTNDLHIHQQWVKSLCGQQRYARAIEVLDGVVERHPDSTPFVEGRWGVYGKWAESLFVRGELAAAWGVLDAARKKTAIKETAGVAADVETTAVIAAREQLIQSGQPDQAQQLLREAMLRRPQLAERLQQQVHLPRIDL